MGNLFNKEKKINYFKNFNSIEELHNAINKSNVKNDFDMHFYISCQKSNMFNDGSSLHDIPAAFPKISSHCVSNPYLMTMDIIKDFVTGNNNNFNLFFIGEQNTDITTIATTEEYELMISEYAENINVNKFGFYSNDIIIKIFNNVLKCVKVSNKFTIVFLLIDQIDFDKQIKKDIVTKLVELSKHPITFICVGTSNNDFQLFDGIDDFDNSKMKFSYKRYSSVKKARKFDNFQFLNFYSHLRRPLINKQIKNIIFSEMFAEISQVYEYIQQKNCLSYVPPSNNIAKNKNKIKEKNIFELTDSDKRKSRRIEITNTTNSIANIDLFTNLDIFDK